jgi:hypothetical protein
MYIDACVRLELPFDEARRRLLSVRPEAGRHMTVPIAGLPVGKDVEVELDSPFEGNAVVSLPLRWKATWPSAAYPGFDGELELTSLSDGSAELWLVGRYQPPLGAIGRTLDRAVLHVLANDSLSHVLQTMASRLQRPLQAAS